MTLSVSDTLGEIKKLINQHAWRDQPTYRALMDEDVSIDQLQIFALQYGVFALHNHNYHGRLYVTCPDAEWRTRIAEVVYEEGTGRLFADGVSHNELWLRFGESIGLTREAMWTARLCPGALALRVYFEWICGKTFLEGCAAHMLAGEAQVTGIFIRIAENLKRLHGLSDEAVSFFTVHDVADGDHSSVGVELLGKFAPTESDRRLVLKTVEDYLGIEDLMYRGIYEEMQKAA
ncbi:MAG: iron-containing redox enzyme family protein [Dongiaceae bacterium]